MNLLRTYRLLWLAFLVIISSPDIFGQQRKHFGQWDIGMEFINPAMAGHQESTRFLLDYRYQWLGIDGAPSTLSGLVSSKISTINVGVGVHYTNDRLGNLNFDNYGLQLNYPLLDNKLRLVLGVELNYGRLSLDASNILLPETPDPQLDPELLPFLNGLNVFTLGFGSLISYKNWKMSLTMRQVSGFNTFSKGIYNTENELFASLEHSFQLNNSIVLVPFYVIYSNFMLAQTTCGARFRINDRFLGSVGARFDENDLESLGASVGWMLTKNLEVHYLYEFGLHDLSAQFNGSHEVSFRYDLPKTMGRLLEAPIIRSPRML